VVLLPDSEITVHETGMTIEEVISDPIVMELKHLHN
jgi:hypothetical protein